MALYQPYSAATSVAKGAGDAGTTAAGGGLGMTIGLMALAVLRQNGTIEIDDQTAAVAVGAITTLGAAVVQGFKRWRRNRAKHK